MARYSPEDKARAIEAMRASAELVEGEMMPRFRAVAKVAGMPSHQTLLRWWDARDRADDGPARTTLQRAREEAAAEGAKSWLRAQHERCRDVAEYILDPMHRTGGPDERIPPHQMARALKDLLPVLADLDKALNGSTERGRQARIAYLHRAAKRVRLTEKRKARAKKK